MSEHRDDVLTCLRDNQPVSVRELRYALDIPVGRPGPRTVQSVLNLHALDVRLTFHEDEICYLRTT